MKKLTKEYVVRETFRRLLVQGRPSVVELDPHNHITPGSRCRYRGSDGTRCAVGTWISDDDYDGLMEGFSATSDTVRGALPEIAGLNEQQTRGFWRKLQMCHDGCETPQDWSVDLPGSFQFWFPDIDISDITRDSAPEPLPY